jgi:hypothetical protein
LDTSERLKAGHVGKEKKNVPEWKKALKKSPLQPDFQGNEFNMKLQNSALGCLYFSRKSDIQISQCMRGRRKMQKAAGSVLLSCFLALPLQIAV